MRTEIIRSGVCHWALVVTVCVCGGRAQTYPDTIWAPVTFYDFHSDRSNPEFEQRHQGGLRAGMVAQTLDAEGKPVIGPKPYMNHYVKYWFRPWRLAARGDFTAPAYSPKAPVMHGYYGGENWKREYQQAVSFDGIIAVDHDTSFKNIVIHDSLPFLHTGDGLYEYRNDSFFPLDHRGFGNEWNHEINNEWNTKNVNHNYSFTMELHWSFVKKPGLTFWFRGDDDVWAFLDNRLQMDLGGIHEARTASFNVDHIPGLIDGRAYDLDVFYAERHSAESHIWITTNILYSPANLRLYARPGPPDQAGNEPIGSLDTVRAGQPYTLYGHVFDSTGDWRPDYDQHISWRIADNGANPPLSATAGASTTFTPVRAGSKATIIAFFQNPDNPRSPAATARVTVYVTPGPAHHLDIQPRHEIAQPAADAEFEQLIFASDEHAKQVYAVIRDRHGNFVGYPDTVHWQVRDHAIAQAIPVTGNSATITKMQDGVGLVTRVLALAPGLAPDSILVGSAGEAASYAVPNPFIPGRSLLPDAAIDRYSDVVGGARTGVLAVIETARMLRKNGTSYGSATIYDAVGNIVARELRVGTGDGPLSYGVHWDGANEIGRFVGGGAYLMRIRGEYASGKPFSTRLKLGVQVP